MIDRTGGRRWQMFRNEDNASQNLLPPRNITWRMLSEIHFYQLIDDY
jgi:hypothetical protein